MMFRLFLVLALASSALAADRPNVLWIVFEDISPEIGAYGYPYAVTPHLDAFAQESVLYTRAYSNGGACAPARSTLITGMYPTSIGTHHMRSEGKPPAYVEAFTESLREAGYYCSNHAKQDYNWIAPPTAWDANDNDWREKGWKQRGGKPFFTVINIADTHSSQTYHPWAPWRERREALAPEERHDPAKAVVPPYYPDTPETREILRRYADNVTFADRKVGEILAALKEDGLADDTIVFFYGDHGTGLPRSKSFQFASSTRVPLLIRFPKKLDALAPTRPGGRVERLVSFVDFAPTVLGLAGVEVPEHLQGQPFLGPGTGFPKQFVYGYRDRMDERYEFIRSVMDGRFHYIRNYYPHLPWFHDQTRLYPSTNPLLEVWHALAAAGKLTGPAAVYMAKTKPREQLFDMREDPDEVRDRSGDADYAGVLAKMRKAYRDWTFQTRDLGFLPEEEMWRRFGGGASSAFDEDPALYPLERIVETADSTDLNLQIERLADPDPTVRYWASVGLVAQGDAARRAMPALLKALEDDSPPVRVMAAQALCAIGECARPLALLAELLEDERPYVALRAANAIDHLDAGAKPLLPKLQTYVASTVHLNARDFFSKAPYPHWVLRHAIEQIGTDDAGLR
jgi:N-sulfoglucosamine sulfohydrolase